MQTFELDGTDGEPVMVTLQRTSAREWVNHIARRGEANLQAEAAPRFEGNRRARRKADAQARKGAPISAPEPVNPDTMRVGFAEAEQAEATRRKRLAEHMEFTREWRAVQALDGRIIDTATPEQRAAREAAVAEEWERLRLAEEASEAVAGNPANPKPELPVAGTAMGIHERVLGAIVGSLESALPGIPIYAEGLNGGESLYASIVAAERERHRREMEAWRTEFERGYLRPTRNAWANVLVDIEAAKVARPAIGKPLSRRARRRNRGRVSAARAALVRVYHEPVTWAWPAQGAA